MATQISNIPNGRKVYIDGDGSPLAEGTVTWYVPKTQSLATIYSDLDGTLSPNPVTLDANGTCVAFGSGNLEELVRDVNGNLVSDSLISIGTITTPTVTPTPTPTSTTHLSLNPADESLSVAPTANPPLSLASLSVQGTTFGNKNREFLVNIGLTSNQDNGQVSASGVNCDKVALYAGIDAQPGTADVWAVNTVLTMEAGSGSYNAQGYELDFNNHDAPRGASGNLITDFTAPIAVGFSATGDATFPGSTSFTSSAAFMAFGGAGNNAQWGRQFVASGKVGICAFQDWTSSAVGFQFDAAHTVADINFTGVYGNAGSASATALFLKNNQNIAWQNNNATNAIADTVDASNNRLVGVGSTGVFVGATEALAPLTAGISLGLATSRWGDVYANNMRLTNSNVLSWENATDTGFVFDYVDNGNNRIIGGGSNTVYTGSIAGIAPVAAGVANCGSTGNPWNQVYTLNGVVGPSDVRLKKEITPLPAMLDKIESVDPISFKWKAQDHGDKIHFGFDADSIKQTFGDVAAFAHDATTDTKHLIKDELIAVLWNGIKELSIRVKALEAK